jgi:hypothetical protein
MLGWGKSEVAMAMIMESIGRYEAKYLQLGP